LIFYGVGTNARYRSISGLAVLLSNSTEVAVYVSDQGNNKIKLITLSTLLTSTVASEVDTSGSGSLGSISIYDYDLFAVVPGAILKYSIEAISYELGTPDLYSGSLVDSGLLDGAYFNARYGYPNHITHDGAGNLYISDHSVSVSGNQIDSVRRLSVQNGIVTTVACKTGINFFLFSCSSC